jgi:predicted enzyme related to lactoylglutathione lyase
MKVTACRYVIAVNDLEKSADYYHHTLGFTVQEMGDPGWRIFKKDDCWIMVGHCPDALSPKELGDHAYFAYIHIDGLDDYFGQVQAKGGHILKPLRDEAWGMREFAVETIDRHRIMFGTDIAPA